MRSIVWLLVVSIVAVVAATALGSNDGLVTIYWLGWRTDLSLNLFLLVLVLVCLATYSLIRSLDSLLKLPERARLWRTGQRDRAAQSALREALALYLAGRYTRAHGAAQRAVAIQANTTGLPPDAEFTALGHLLSAGSLHRLQDRTRRDEQLQRALDMGRLTRKPRATEEGARLLAAECAIDDRDAPRALRDLAELPPGVARRTHALRLRLNAARLAHQPMDAWRTARLLAKHQGFTQSAADGLLRTLAIEVLTTARDADQLRELWKQLDANDHADALLVARAAIRMSELGDAAQSRQWLAPLWESIDQRDPDACKALARALGRCLLGLEAEWLPRLDRATPAALRSPALGLTVGLAFAQRQLWGKARTLLLSAANDAQLDAGGRRQAWAALAQLAEREQRVDEATRYWRAAALADVHS